MRTDTGPRRNTETGERFEQGERCPLTQLMTTQYTATSTFHMNELFDVQKAECTVLPHLKEDVIHLQKNIRVEH